MKTREFIFKLIMIHLIIIGQGCSNQLDDSHSENKEDHECPLKNANSSLK